MSTGIFYINFSLITRGQRNKTKAYGDGSAEVVSLGGESRVESSCPSPERIASGPVLALATRGTGYYLSHTAYDGRELCSQKVIATKLEVTTK